MANGNKQIFIAIPSGELVPTTGGAPFSETDAAYGFMFYDREVKVWVPKSRTQDLTQNFETFKVEFWLEEWLVSEKQLGKYRDNRFEPALPGFF